MIRTIILIAVLNVLARSTATKIDGNDLLVVTVATNETDGFKIMKESLEYFKFKHKVFLGLNEIWKGGDVKTSIGGGQKINIIKKYMEDLIKKSNETLILYCDGYDVIFNDDPDNIVNKFLMLQKRLVFSAEDFCWPDKKLESKYAKVSENETRFLNSGLFMGYKEDVLDMLDSIEIENSEDDQLAYTKYFLSKIKGKENNDIALDTKSLIFQNLNGAENFLQITFENGSSVLNNQRSGSKPSILHGNGPTKLLFAQFSNYLADRWIPNFGCRHCDQNVFDLETINRNEWPMVLVAVTVEVETPFFEEFLKKLSILMYPKSKIGLHIHSGVDRHNSQIQQFETLAKSYHFFEHSNENITEQKARYLLFVQSCKLINCDYLFLLDSSVQMDEPESLAFLIGLNRSVIAPILRRPGKLFTNFWGAIDQNGFYKRSSDYISIAEDERIGIWNVPHVSSCVLIKREVVDQFNFTEVVQDEDMRLTAWLRENGIYMWASNLHSYGHLVDPENFNRTARYPELYEIFNNIEDWKERYLHPQFLEHWKQKDIQLNEWRRKYLSDLVGVDVDVDHFFIQQPCPDVYWFPLLSERFAEEMIGSVNQTNLWSMGRHNDARIPGGYENVPTDDVHMTQIGFHIHWDYFLKQFVQPIQMKVFLGYYKDPPRAPLTFVVRYDLSIQDRLRAHHDASTYTLDIALNRAGIDYQDGGVRFVRYNCSLVDTRVGWPLMFPGRLTHFHEGLKISGGKRYVLVSFIDP